MSNAGIDGTDAKYPTDDRTIQSIFEDIVRAAPDRVAVTAGNEHVTYGAANARANQLAHRLIALGVGPDKMVGCFVERSSDLIAILLGIIKAGGGYLPLDPQYPVERLDYMIQDAAPVAVVTTRAMLSRLPSNISVPAVVVDCDLGGESVENPACRATPRSAVYVMYTSGSTGKPKGVVCEQRSIVRLVKEANYCAFGPDDAWLQYAPLAFDASTLEIWAPLLNGGRVVMAPPVASLEKLGSVIREGGVTSAWLTSGLFNLMAETRLADLKLLKVLITGGDIVSPTHLKLLREANPDCTLVNGYGPTENTTFTCCHVMAPGSAIPDPVPIGRPITGTTVYLLDDQLQPVGEGETGELYTGGAGVAREYLNNRESTAEKFLPDPFAKVAGATMYRTGDLARWRKDGTVDFLGRADNQVKILGYRIEPGEIETVLAELPGMGQVCVVPHSDGRGAKRLVAYYVGKDQELRPGKVREYLLERLPRHMIPALIVPLCSLPLNVNGKVDRAALPKPDFGGDADLPELKAGASLEETITAIWGQVLHIDRIGPDANFFDIGGDSLRLAAAHARLERALGREFAIIDMFEHTSVRALARHLQGGMGTEGVGAETGARGQRQRDAFAANRARRQRTI